MGGITIGYDMYLIKADKRKLSTLDGLKIYYEEMERATICDINSYDPILRRFHNDREDLRWIWEEYNYIPSDVFSDIVNWLKEKIENEDFEPGYDRMYRMVYDNIKDWLPLSEYEAVFFEEDA